jgi:SAM-dependent methyltransferase
VSGQPARDVPATERYLHYYRSEPPPAPKNRYHEWLSRAEARLGVGRLLEAGAGSGGFVQVALERGWRVEATEVAPGGIERLRALGVQVFEGDVEDAGYREGRFDLVVSLEVIEHLPHPSTHLESIARATRDGGLLLLTTPNFAGVASRWFGVRWRAVDPEHLGYFTPRVLAQTAQRAGYRAATVRSRSVDVSAWSGRPDPDGVAQFDPEASAHLRDAVESRWLLRFGRETVNRLLGLTGLGDTLLLCAER